MCFVLLNPSTADETREGPTVRRCIRFARSLGYGALEVVNLYAYVATDPAELRRAGYPVGRSNDRHIEAAVKECERVVLAWGVHAARLKRPAEVLELLGRMGVKPHCLRLTASGHPEQPAEATAGGRSGEIPRPSGKSGNTGHPSPLTQGGKTYRNMLSFWVCIEGPPTGDFTFSTPALEAVPHSSR